MCPLFSSPQYGQLLRLYQQPDRSWLPRHTADQSLFFEFQNHLVNRGRRRLKVSFQVSFGWCATVDLRVVVDERKILTLFLRKSHFHLMIHLFGTTMRLTGSRNYRRSGGATGYTFSFLISILGCSIIGSGESVFMANCLLPFKISSHNFRIWKLSFSVSWYPEG